MPAFLHVCSEGLDPGHRFPSLAEQSLQPSLSFLKNCTVVVQMSMTCYILAFFLMQ